MYPLVLSIVLLTISLGLLGLNIAPLTGLTWEIIRWCRDIFALCLPYTAIIRWLILWFAALTIAGGLVYAIVKAGLDLIKAGRTLKNLPLKDRNLSVAIIKDDTLLTAFTCGLFSPKIYLSTGLIKELSKEELKTVMFHEIHHRRSRDPLKFFLLSFIKNLLFYLPAVSCLVKKSREDKEKAADRSAVKRTKEPLVLASALLKIAMPSKNESAAITVSIKGTGLLKERIEGLIEGKEIKSRDVPARTVISSAALALLLFSIMALPVFFPEKTSAKTICEMSRCTMHSATHSATHTAMDSAMDSKRFEKQCKTHCNKKG